MIIKIKQQIQSHSSGYLQRILHVDWLVRWLTDTLDRTNE